MLLVEVVNRSPIQTSPNSHSWGISEWIGIISAATAVVAAAFTLIQYFQTNQARQEAVEARKDAKKSREDVEKLTEVAIRTEKRDLDDRRRLHNDRILKMRSEVRKIKAGMQFAYTGEILLQLFNGSAEQFLNFSLKDIQIDSQSDLTWKFVGDSTQVYPILRPGLTMYPFTIVVLDAMHDVRRPRIEEIKWVIQVTDNEGRLWVYPRECDPILDEGATN